MGGILRSSKRLIQAERWRHNLAYGGGAAVAYIDRVLNTGPYVYFPAGEQTGTNADNYEGTAARDGTFLRDVSIMGTGAGIGDGNTAPVFDGTNDACDIYSVSLNGAWDGDEGTAQVWAIVDNAGVWTDGVARDMFQIGTDGINFLFIEKAAAANQVDFKRWAFFGSTVNHPFNDTGWNHFAATWSVAADEFRAFVNGTQVGATQVGLGGWAGALNLQLCAFGASSNVPTRQYDGRVAHCALWDTPLAPALIAELAVV